MAITTDQIYGTRERWYQKTPSMRYSSSINSNAFREEIFQSEFLSQLDPAGHRINDPLYYEDIVREEKDENGKPTGNYVIEKIERVSVPIQEVILEKHLVHLCGEKLKFIFNKTNPSETEASAFVQHKQGWDKRNMETAKYEFCRSVKATGDGAFCAVLTNKKFSYRVFSVANGDGLHPIRDFYGNLRIFGRSFTVYDYEKQENVPYLEVWDDKYYTLLSYSTDPKKKAIKWDENYLPKLTDGKDPDGWEVVSEPKLHGFKSIPIVYLKNEKGACWSNVQHLIDKFEMALSQLFQNNRAFAFRILVVKGGVHITGDLKGHARVMAFDDEKGDVKTVEGSDASESFKLQLEQTFKAIQLGSFIVIPPDIPSGDLPGVTIKIMYSPAIEQGINDKNFFNKSIDKIVELFKDGYSYEVEGRTDFANLDIRGDIQIYVHQNDAEIANNLVLGVQAGFTSIETASDTSVYSASDEVNRLRKQKEQEIEDERRSLANQNDGQNPTNTIRKQIAQA